MFVCIFQCSLTLRDGSGSGFGSCKTSGCRKRGVEFKGGSLHDGFGGFDGFGGSGEHLTFLFLVLSKYSTMRQPWRF